MCFVVFAALRVSAFDGIYSDEGDAWIATLIEDDVWFHPSTFDDSGVLITYASVQAMSLNATSAMSRCLELTDCVAVHVIQLSPPTSELVFGPGSLRWEQTGQLYVRAQQSVIMFILDGYAADVGEYYVQFSVDSHTTVKDVLLDGVAVQSITHKGTEYSFVAYAPSRTLVIEVQGKDSVTMVKTPTASYIQIEPKGAGKFAAKGIIAVVVVVVICFYMCLGCIKYKEKKKRE